MRPDAQDRFFLAQTDRAKRESYDPGRNVGAVVVNARGEFLAWGTNRPPLQLGLSQEETHRIIENDPRWKYFVVEHAERNALDAVRRSGHTAEGGTIYISLFPCADCARAIVSSGIIRVVCPLPDLDLNQNMKWSEHFKYASIIFDMARVKVDAFEGHNENSYSLVTRIR